MSYIPNKGISTKQGHMYQTRPYVLNNIVHTKQGHIYYDLPLIESPTRTQVLAGSCILLTSVVVYAAENPGPTPFRKNVKLLP